MKSKMLFLVPVIILLFCSAKFPPEVFTLNKFEESLSKISDRFYVSKYEVDNLQYMAFLSDLKTSGKTDQYKIADIDSLQWRDKLAYNEPYVELYHKHPAFRTYPVVNISYEGALLYCEWLTEKYNSFEKRKFKKVKFRLPTKDEWENAAHGGLKDNSYPWGGYSLVNNKGIALCNYRGVGDESIHYDSDKKALVVVNTNFAITDVTSGQGTITAPVGSYFPNGLGIYNISGNVSEMISEKGIVRGGSYRSPGYDVRIESSENYTHPQTNIGFRICMDVIETWK